MSREPIAEALATIIAEMEQFPFPETSLFGGWMKQLRELKAIVRSDKGGGTTDTPHLCRHEEVCATVCHDCGHARCTACEPKCLWCDPLNEEAT